MKLRLLLALLVLLPLTVSADDVAAGLPAAATQAEIVYDRKNNVLLLQLEDPDNNTVQVMQPVDDE